MSTTLTIHHLDDAVRQRLSVKAVRHGLSVEAEAKAILTRAVEMDEPTSRPTLGKGTHLVRGMWKGRGTADEMIKELRGED